MCVSGGSPLSFKWSCPPSKTGTEGHESSLRPMFEKLICGWTSLLMQILLIVMQVQNSQSLYADLVLDRSRPVFGVIHQQRLLARYACSLILKMMNS